MPRPPEAINERLMSKVSSMYYHHNYNQQEIADRLHLSRPKVSRLIKQAHEHGIVQITVISPDGNFVDLETSLEERYELKEVLVVETDETDFEENGTFLKKQLGVAAAHYLLRTISDGDTLGITWGTTLQAMIEAMQSKPTKDVHVVQTLGGVGPPEARSHAAELSRRLSHLLNCSLTLLQAQGIVSNKQAREVLMTDRQVQAAFDLFSDINTAYVGIGALTTNPVLMKDDLAIPQNIYHELVEAGAVGDIALRFFDENGKKIVTSMEDRLLGISFEELEKVETVVGIAGGKRKINAIRGALKGHLIDVLITDHKTAEHLIEHSKK